MIRSLPLPACRLTIAAGLLLFTSAAQALTFISPMGEPFRSGPGDKPPEAMWFDRADKNGDGRITRAEFLADAGIFFMALDVNRNGEIGPEEIQRYEEDVAPEVSTDGFNGGHRSDKSGGSHARRHGRGGHRGGNDDLDGEGVSSSASEPSPQEHYDAAGEGASRFSYLDLPEPITAADTDFNRGVSPKEFAAAATERFDALDANHDGVLTRDELPRLGGAQSSHGSHRPGGNHRSGQDRPDSR